MRYLVGFVSFLLALGTLGVVGCAEEEVVEICAVEVLRWLKDDPPPLDPDHIIGTYTLERIEIELYVDGVPVGYLTSFDFDSWSGALEIQESTLTATVTVEGETNTISGPYTRTITRPEEGVFSIDDVSGSYEFTYGIEARCDLDCQPGLNWYPTEPFCCGVDCPSPE
jgi:hypothetical protein